MKENKQRIYSQNAAFQKFEVLKRNRNKRYKYGEFFVEGVRNINQAIENNWNISSFLYAYDVSLSNWAKDILTNVKTDLNYELPSELMKLLSGKEDTSELLAVVKMHENRFSRLPLSDNPLFALFDRPSNHGNLGTIIRSCDAMGIEGLIITGHGVDMYDPDVISSTMGSFFRVPVIHIAENESVLDYINGMKKRYTGFQVLGSTAHHEKKLSDVDCTRPTLFMIGNETEGLSRKFKEISDILITIPMSENASASSLNVACAATVLFYEAAKQRTNALCKII